MGMQPSIQHFQWFPFLVLIQVDTLPLEQEVEEPLPETVPADPSPVVETPSPLPPQPPLETTPEKAYICFKYTCKLYLIFNHYVQWFAFFVATAQSFVGFLISCFPIISSAL